MYILILYFFLENRREFNALCQRQIQYNNPMVSHLKLFEGSIMIGCYCERSEAIFSRFE